MKAVVLVTVLAACGSSDRQTASGTAPTEFEPPPPPPPDETFEQMKARFEAENP